MNKKIIILVVFSFLINLLWEICHSFLYNWNVYPLRNEIAFYISRILISSFGDLIFLIIIFSLISLKNKNVNWIKKPEKYDYVIAIILGVIVSLIIEIRAVTEGRWQYSSSMPVLFGIGITPLLQLAVTSVISLWIVKD